MKTRLIILGVLLAIFMILYASEDPSETTGYDQKKQELDQLAQRFKADTGFKGEIESYPEQMRLARFTGNFDDINMTNVRDSVAFRQVCNSIINKLLPYIGAESEQLVPERINVDSNQIDTRFYQIVNGYKVESGGYLNIYYLFEQKRFGILNVTLDIPQQPVGKIITDEEAKSIVVTHHRNKFNVPKKVWGQFITIDLKYSNIGVTDYKLMYLVTLDDITYYVDANTGMIYGTNSFVDNLASSVLVRGKVYYPCITSLTPIVYSDSLAMQGIEVVFNNRHDNTNEYGYVTFPDSTLSSYKVLLSNESFTISDYTDSLTTISSSEYSHPYNIYETLLGDSCIVNGIETLCYAPNIYEHADAQIVFQKKINTSYNANMRVITNYNLSNPNISGQISYSSNIIRIRNGIIPNYIKHEFGHHFVWDALSTTFAPQSELKAMDESFAHYLSCASVSWAQLIYPNGGNPLMYNLSLPAPIDIWISNIGLINESKYGCYLCGLNIASAWWTLRDNSAFGPNPRPGVKAFDDLLVKTLTEDTDTSEPFRYKPRYFYNLLMQRTADPLHSDNLTVKQQAIADAYNSRGLHFYPKVESYSGGNKGRNIYTLNDSVHVSVSNCPQNTRINIYVIKHDEYTYVDGAPISSLNDCLASGFTPITSVTTDEFGKWSGPLWTASEVGNYDIIVDVGDPDTSNNPGAPNGIIHYAFSGANVMDGFDGRINAGFTVVDKGIDVVMALDVSGSMTNLSDELKSCVQRFISAMVPGDNINVFGFNEYTYPVLPTSNQQLYPITTDNQSSIIADLDSTIINPVSFTDLYVPYDYGYHCYNDSLYRKKGMILLSDGVHNPSSGNAHTMGNVVNCIHTYYNPRNIACYTMRFGNESYGAQNTSYIAVAGHGVTYYVPSLQNMDMIISRLLGWLRGNPPSYDKSASIPPNTTHTIQFSVDDSASRLYTTLICNSSASTADIACILHSPTGLVYNQPTIINNHTLKFNITYPECGVWEACISNNSASMHDYSLVSELDSDIQIAMDEIPPFISANTPLLVKVAISDYISPVQDAVLNVILTKGTWQHNETLFDDGNHNDGIAGVLSPECWCKFQLIVSLFV